jgi:hypothetical protein
LNYHQFRQGFSPFAVLFSIGLYAIQIEKEKKYVVFAAHNFISGEGDGKPLSRILGAFEGKFSRSIQWFLSAIQIDKVQPLLSGKKTFKILLSRSKKKFAK